MSTTTRFVSIRKRTRISWILAVALALSATTLVAGARGWFSDYSETKGSEDAIASRKTTDQNPPTAAFAVNRAELGHHVIRALDALGNRFESPAKGRSILTGTISHRNGPTPFSAPITLVRQFPDRIRFEERTVAGLRVLGHDGTRSWVLTGNLSEDDATLVEELVRDNVEHFITGQALGDATFHLGDMFRTDDGTDPNYTRPFFDILRVDDTFYNSDGKRSRTTLYYLNSRSGLPERIAYEAQARGEIVKIEVEFSDWTTVAGERLPQRTTWKKAGTVVAELVINHVVFAPFAEDGIFAAPSRR